MRVWNATDDSVLGAREDRGALTRRAWNGGPTGAVYTQKGWEWDGGTAINPLDVWQSLSLGCYLVHTRERKELYFLKYFSHEPAMRLVNTASDLRF